MPKMKTRAGHKRVSRLRSPAICGKILFGFLRASVVKILFHEAFIPDLRSSA